MSQMVNTCFSSHRVHVSDTETFFEFSISQLLEVDLKTFSKFQVKNVHSKIVSENRRFKELNRKLSFSFVQYSNYTTSYKDRW